MGPNPIASISISSLHLHVQNSPPDGGLYLQGSGREVPATLRVRVAGSIEKTMEELTKCDMDVIVVDHDGTSVDYFETLNEIPGCCWKLDPNNIPFSMVFQHIYSFEKVGP